MDKILSILLIEDDVEACNELRHSIEKNDLLKLVEMTNDAHKALDYVRAHLPNVIILDLELHLGGGNGLMFLNDLKKLTLEHQPYILVTTNNMSEVTLEQARRLGADFTLAKYEDGYSADYVVDHIELMRAAILKKNSKFSPLPEMSPAEAEQLLIKRIHRELDLVGINPKAIGYQYLVDSIILTIQGCEETLGRALSTKYNKTGVSIERAMQNAIKQAWTTNDVEDLLQFYTARIRPEKGSPTLMEFVCYYANKLKNDID